MAYEICPNANEECVWYNRPAPDCLKSTQEHGCFSDNDHILPRSLGETALDKAYLELPSNQQQICRAEHDQKTQQEIHDPPQLPDRETMRESIAKAINEGIVSFSGSKIKKIFGDRHVRNHRYGTS